MGPVDAFIKRNQVKRGTTAPKRKLVVVDPFCGTSERADYSNDIRFGGVDAGEFCRDLLRKGVRADVILFDPPYSPRQISECYKEAGMRPSTAHTQNSALYKRVRVPCMRLLRPGGMTLSFGWSAMGFGKTFFYEEILIVNHGGGHNSTICVAQSKPGRLA
jgi:hypothetical protein